MASNTYQYLKILDCRHNRRKCPISVLTQLYTDISFNFPSAVVFVLWGCFIMLICHAMMLDKCQMIIINIRVCMKGFQKLFTVVIYLNNIFQTFHKESPEGDSFLDCLLLFQRSFSMIELSPQKAVYEVLPIKILCGCFSRCAHWSFMSCLTIYCVWIFYLMLEVLPFFEVYYLPPW